MFTKAHAVAVVFLLGIGIAGFGSVPSKTEAPSEHEIIEAVVLEDRGGSKYITFKIRVEKANLHRKDFKENAEMEVVILSFVPQPPLGKLCVMELRPIKVPNGTDWIIEKWWLKAGSDP